MARRTAVGRAAARLRAVVGLAAAQLRHYRTRTVLAVAGVALAVLLLVVLVGTGYGLTTTGEQAIGWFERDLWLSGGPVALAPAGVGGVENPIEDAHAVAREVESRPGVRDAQAMAFQTVYVSPDPEGFDTVVGVGVTGNGSRVLVSRGSTFSTADVHYADGSYDGPMTGEVIVDPRTARRYNLSVGDRLYVGGTLASARETPFRVVGVSRSFSTFLGTSTVAVHLSELQAVSGTTGTDRAAIIAVTLAPGADRAATERRLERAYPAFEVRTNDEQVRAIVGRQASVVAGAATLVVLAVVAGVVLVVNVLALVVYQQRQQLAALKAAGVSARSLVGVVVGQGVGIGLLGGAAGLAAVPPTVDAVNQLAADLSGFPNLVKTPPWLFALGVCIAVGMGVLGAAVAGWRVTRLGPLDWLER